MWPDLREEVELEMAMLREHVESVAPLRAKVAISPPDLVERMALGAFLHGFYNGVENTFKRIAIHMDGGPPRGEAWHQQLLESMTQPGIARPAVISALREHNIDAAWNVFRSPASYGKGPQSRLAIS